MKTNRYDLNDVVVAGDDWKPKGRVVRITLENDQVEYNIQFEDGTISEEVPEEQLMLVRHCEMDEAYGVPTPIDDYVDLRYQELDEEYALEQQRELVMQPQDMLPYLHVPYTFNLPSGLSIDRNAVAGCTHQWVDVGFMKSKVVCKHCNQEQFKVE